MRVVVQGGFLWQGGTYDSLSMIAKEITGTNWNGPQLAIYKRTGRKQVDAAKAMANFTGWTYAAVNAIAS